MAKLTASVLASMMKKSNKEQRQKDQALGFSYYEVNDDYLYLVKPDGTKKRVRKAVFGLRKLDLPSIKYSDGLVVYPGFVVLNLNAFGVGYSIKSTINAHPYW
jgi:hypothetical protein